jgi:hypothetical protein
MPPSLTVDRPRFSAVDPARVINQTPPQAIGHYLGRMADVVMLERPVYGTGEAADLLRLRTDRVLAWLNGYTRKGVTPHVIVSGLPLIEGRRGVRVRASP